VPLKFFDKTVEKIRGRTDKPILLQEFGIATTGNDKHHTEENQERYVREILERGSKENLDGFIVWKFNDHPEDLKNLDIPWGRVYDNESFKEAAFHQGILRTDYSKKPVAYVVQQYYKQIL
ncbi:hypothetical protein KGY79_11430, partial [Candidatus Bipolaricaulota bacterium]|nr:hypothetical protein [Candidatus Bipolaricaulota bacterium]